MTFEEKLRELRVEWIMESMVQRVSSINFRELVSTRVIKVGNPICSFDNSAESDFRNGIITKICIDESKFKDYREPWIKIKVDENEDENVSIKFSCSNLVYLQDVGYGYFPLREENNNDEAAAEVFCRMHCDEDCEKCGRNCPCYECGEREKKSKECCEKCKDLICICSEEDDGDYEESYKSLFPANSVYEIADRISKAAGKKIKLDVVRSIKEDPYQAQAEIDGETITFGKGLIDVLSEDETASIIAHETAHLEKRTIYNSMPETGKTKEEVLKGLQKAWDESMTGSKISRIIKATTIGVGVVAAVAGGIAISKSKMRENEENADIRAVQILHEAGYDPSALANALEKLGFGRGRSTRKGLIDSILATHPETSKRIEKIKEEKEKIKTRSKKK